MSSYCLGPSRLSASENDPPTYRLYSNTHKHADPHDHPPTGADRQPGAGIHALG